MVAVCIASFQVIGELKKQKDCISHVLQCLAGMDEHVNDSCRQRAKCLCRSLVIIHTHVVVSSRHPSYWRSWHSSRRLIND